MKLRTRLLVILTPIVIGTLMVIAIFASATAESTVAEYSKSASDPRLRIAHLAPFNVSGGTAVTVTLSLQNNTLITTVADIEYLDSTNYSSIAADSYIFRVFPGGSASPVVEKTILLSSDMDYTSIIIGDDLNQNLDLLTNTDDNSAPSSGNARLRLGHLAPFSNTIAGTLVDLRLQSGSPVLTEIQYSQIVADMELPEGEYDFKITSPGGDITLIDPLTVTLNNGEIFDAFAVGDGTNQALGAYEWPRNSTGALLPLSDKANIQLVHLAPIDTGSTALTITLDSTPVVTNFVYGDSTAYFSIDAGPHDVQVFVGSSASSPVPINVNVGMEYSLFVKGGNIHQASDVQLSANNNASPPVGKANLRFGNLSPYISGSAPVDIRLQDGTPMITDVVYGEFTDYLEFAAGIYDLKITNQNGVTTLVDLLPLTLNAGDIGMAVVSGDDINESLGTYLIPNGKIGEFLPVGETPIPSLTIRKWPDGQEVAYGETVTFTISVTNTGTITITDVTVADEFVPMCNKDLGILNPGQTGESTCSLENVTSSFTNTAVVTGTTVSIPFFPAQVISDTDDAKVLITTRFINLPIILK